MPHRTTITEHWSGAQPRNYADHQWEGTIRFETFVDDEWTPDETPRMSVILMWVERVVGRFAKDRTEYEWPGKILDYVEQDTDEPAVTWRYRVTSPYVD